MEMIRIKKTYIFLFLLLLIYLFLISIEARRFNILIYLQNAFVVLFAGYNLFVRKSRYPFSLYQIFNVFSLIFFGFTPLLIYKFDSQFFQMGYVPDEYYIKSYFSLILFLLIYDFLYTYFNSRNVSSTFLYNLFDYSKLRKNGKIVFNNCSIVILIVLVVAFLVFILSVCDYSIVNIVLSVGQKVSAQAGLSQPVDLIFSNFIRPFCLILFLFYFLLGKNKYYKLLLFAFASFIILPTAVPRYMSGILYTAVLLLCIKFCRKENLLSYTMIGGIVYLFPLLNQTRFSNFTSFNFKFNPQFFLNAHFDSFASYVQITNHEMITWGRQLLGTILFFVPRSVWPDKPIGSGWYYSEQLGANFNNVAVNYFAEGYINFGYFGVFIFTLGLAYFCAMMDKTYWKNNCFENKNGFTILYYLTFGLLFFVLRGDLMSSVAYGISLYAVVFFINSVLKLSNNKSN